MRQEILWVLRGGGGGVGVRAQQETFQAEGTAIPFPGLCLEASPGTCLFPGRVCVYVYVCVCVCTQVPSLVGEDPTCCVTWPKKKKRFWPVCPVSQVGTGMESAGGRAQLGRSVRLLENRTGFSLGALSGPCPLHLSTAVDTTSCWEHRAGDCSQILSNLKTVSNCRMPITCLL